MSFLHPIKRLTGTRSRSFILGLGDETHQSGLWAYGNRLNTNGLSVYYDYNGSSPNTKFEVYGPGTYSYMDVTIDDSSIKHNMTYEYDAYVTTTCKHNEIDVQQYIIIDPQPDPFYKKGLFFKVKDDMDPTLTLENNDEKIEITPTGIKIGIDVVPRYRGSDEDDPDDPVAGDEYWNTTDSKFYKYNGTDWIALN